jgi:acyl carrier protein
VGELYVGGDCLARGYLNRPELTAETFIANPFSSEPGARLYRTGDLARYKSDGNTEFLGRIDNQVKIRGFRIELGEIESALDQHPMIRESAVLAREDNPKDPSAEFTLSPSAGLKTGCAEGPRTGKRLVAYVVPKAEVLLTRQELRSFLKGKLPEYMIPAVFVFLDALPLTLSGKVDRNALPLPDRSQRDFSLAFVAPRTPVEAILARIWEDVLRLEKAGIHDNFFDLGGHSLLATQLVSRIRQSLQVEVPLQAIFEAPTIGEMALVIAVNQAKAARQKDLEGMLGEVEGMSEQEAELVLAGENTGRDKVNQHE